MRLRVSLPWSNKIRSWKAFNQAAEKSDVPLLSELRRFPDSVLVAGCQRSGTTAVTRVIAGSAGFARFRISHDDELDAALILSGIEDWVPEKKRYCFQTTYLNKHYSEYFDPSPDFRLVWVIRQPHAVIHSMIYHWDGAALDQLFQSCGRSVAIETLTRNGTPPENIRLSRLEKACFSYVGKSAQLHEISRRLPRGKLIVIDYDTLCRSPTEVLSAVFSFVDEPFHESYAAAIVSSSIDKGSLLSATERALVDKLCWETFTGVSRYAVGFGSD